MPPAINNSRLTSPMQPIVSTFPIKAPKIVGPSGVKTVPAFIIASGVAEETPSYAVSQAVIAVGNEANKTMRAVMAVAGKYGVEGEASWDESMACGTGACLGCMVETKDGLKRACADGPVFRFSELAV